MKPFRANDEILTWQNGYETIHIQSWGENSLRIRATCNPQFVENEWALLLPQPAQAIIEIQEQSASLQNGKITAHISAAGQIHFTHTQSGKLLAGEPQAPLNHLHPGRRYKLLEGGLYRIEARFLPHPGERFYGLGQHQHGHLDQKGCVIELSQRNTEISIPFMLSSRGYGFLWNNPAVGRVELAANGTLWLAEASRQIDYWITAGDKPAEIMEAYARATGYPPPFPDWAAGFWQSKLRYATQQELLNIAREYRQRGLPLSVIVIDGGHWSKMGEWRFDPAYWPDPAGMARDLESLGIKVMVSVWPMIGFMSSNFEEMKKRGYLVQTRRGVPLHTILGEDFPSGPDYLYLYDATHPEARRFLWQQIDRGYYQHGIRIFWLDACEPEFYPTDHDNIRYHLGDGLEVSNLYPLLHQQALYEGMQSQGETEIITLSRSAWAGSQRFGAAVWSGDIPCTFDALQKQVRAGLNIAMSGIPWWTTDIGGFLGGDPDDDEYRELLIRWFQYGAFCPLFRLHGFRLNKTGWGSNPAEWSGGPNEVWSFGEQAYQTIRELLFLRQRLQPYIMEQMHIAHMRGIPPMRPLFFDFPADPATITIDDQFMFGPDLLVAPILEQGCQKRLIYLPAGEQWTDAWTNKTTKGGHWAEVPVSLDSIPLFLRNNKQLPIRT